MSFPIRNLSPFAYKSNNNNSEEKHHSNSSYLPNVNNNMNNKQFTVCSPRGSDKVQKAQIFKNSAEKQNKDDIYKHNIGKLFQLNSRTVSPRRSTKDVLNQVQHIHNDWIKKEKQVKLDMKNAFFQSSKIKRSVFKPRRGAGVPYNMLLIMHFEGLLGLYDRPFFFSFNYIFDNLGRSSILEEQNQDYREPGFNEKFLVLRKNLKQCLQHLSKFFMIIIIFPESFIYKGVQRYLIDNKYAIDAMYEIESGVRHEQYTQEYNLVLDDFGGSALVKKILLFDTFALNHNHNFFQINTKHKSNFAAQLFQNEVDSQSTRQQSNDQQYDLSYLKHLTIFDNNWKMFFKKFPRLNFPKDNLKLIYFPSLIFRDNPKQSDCTVFQNCSTYFMFELEQKKYLLCNRTMWGVLDLEQIYKKIYANIMEKKKMDFCQRLLDKIKFNYDELYERTQQLLVKKRNSQQSDQNDEQQPPEGPQLQLQQQILQQQQQPQQRWSLVSPQEDQDNSNEVDYEENGIQGEDGGASDEQNAGVPPPQEEGEKKSQEKIKVSFATKKQTVSQSIVAQILEKYSLDNQEQKTSMEMVTEDLFARNYKIYKSYSSAARSKEQMRQRYVIREYEYQFKKQQQKNCKNFHKLYDYEGYSNQDKKDDFCNSKNANQQKNNKPNNTFYKINSNNTNKASSFYAPNIRCGSNETNEDDSKLLNNNSSDVSFEKLKKKIIGTQNGSQDNPEYKSMHHINNMNNKNNQSYNSSDSETNSDNQDDDDCESDVDNDDDDDDDYDDSDYDDLVNSDYWKDQELLFIKRYSNNVLFCFEMFKPLLMKMMSLTSK